MAKIITPPVRCPKCGTALQRYPAQPGETWHVRCPRCRYEAAEEADGSVAKRW